MELLENSFSARRGGGSRRPCPAATARSYAGRTAPGYRSERCAAALLSAQSGRGGCRETPTRLARAEPPESARHEAGCAADEPGRIDRAVESGAAAKRTGLLQRRPGTAQYAGHPGVARGA